MKKWEELPPALQTEAVRPYYELLYRRRGALFVKRCFDVAASLVLLILLLPCFLLLGAAIRLDSPGPVFYRQLRVTQYGRTFRIFKFRSMVQGADAGTQVTLENDARVTRVGRFIRRYRLDELCQLLNILGGSMTFVGTRPEVPCYVERYTPEMMATLLLPAGVTGMASICFVNEAELLAGAEDADRVYVEQLLPAKMEYNLAELRRFSLGRDLKLMGMTVLAVLGRDYGKIEQEKAKTRSPA